MTSPRNGSPTPAALELIRPRSQSPVDVRVLIADADGLARGMMRFALSHSDRIGVVHAAQNGREALELARYFRPDVAILDTVDTAERGARAGSHAPARSSPICGCSRSRSNDHRTAIAALRAGAVGHIAKDTDPDGLAELVVRAADGEAIVSQRLMPALLDALREVPDSGWRPLRSRLTTREWEIVELLGDGATTQRIADQLVLSPMTVYSHTKSILSEARRATHAGTL